MRSQSVLVLAVAALFGLLAVFVANAFLRDESEQVATAPAGLAKVVVARVPLYFGSNVTSEHLKLVDWPANAVPPGAFRSVSEVLGGGTRVALRPIELNEPVLASKVSGKGGRLSMSGLISADKRAATIRVNDVVGVGGFLLPGDRVDVMITRALPGDNDEEQTITDVLLQNVRVVGVDQDANEAKDKPTIVKAVTVEVTQEQAQKLALGQQVGTLSLALRNLTNVAMESPRTVRLNDLRDGAKTAVPVHVAYRTVTRYRAPRAAAQTVEIVRGTQASTYPVQRYAGL